MKTVLLVLLLVPAVVLTAFQYRASPLISSGDSKS